MKKPEIDPIFALGEENPFGQYFVGQSYLRAIPITMPQCSPRWTLISTKPQ